MVNSSHQFEISKDSPGIEISYIVFGDRACITHPTGKPDNSTLPILTPTAAKGISDSILLDMVSVEDRKLPAFRHVITAIGIIPHPNEQLRHVQGQIEQHMLNGVKQKIKWGRKSTRQVFDRIQRSISILLAPAFLVRERLALLPAFKFRTGDKDKSLKAYAEIFSRRIAKGYSYKPIHFGLHMFPGQIKPYDGESLLPLSFDIGPLIYDGLYDEFTGKLLHRRYLWARVTDGLMDCDWLSGNIKLVLENEVRS